MHSDEKKTQKAPVVNKKKYKTKTSQTENKINKSSNVSVLFLLSIEKDQHETLPPLIKAIQSPFVCLTPSPPHLPALHR